MGSSVSAVEVLLGLGVGDAGVGGTFVVATVYVDIHRVSKYYGCTIRFTDRSEGVRK